MSTIIPGHLVRLSAGLQADGNLVNLQNEVRSTLTITTDFINNAASSTAITSSKTPRINESKPKKKTFKIETQCALTTSDFRKFYNAMRQGIELDFQFWAGYTYYGRVIPVRIGVSSQGIGIVRYNITFQGTGPLK